MLGDNIKELRKRQGMTQEQLAQQLHVVRQTVSKWEKNSSVPDADLLEKIAEILNTDVNILLGTSLEQREDADLSLQLSRLNELLAAKERKSKRVWRAVILVVFAAIVMLVLQALFGTTVSVTESTAEAFSSQIPLLHD